MTVANKVGPSRAHDYKVTSSVAPLGSCDDKVEKDGHSDFTDGNGGDDQILAVAEQLSNNIISRVCSIRV